jgi:hypothetical protein
MKIDFRLIGRGWDSFWFSPEKPYALAICRVFFFATLLYLYEKTDFTLCARLPVVCWQPVSFYFFLSSHGPPSVAWLSVMQIVWKISLLTSLLGFFTRTSSWTSCLLGIYLIGLPNQFGKVSHPMAAASLTLFVMAFSHCGRVYSLDACFARWRGKNAAPLSSPEYRWPIQLVRLIISSVFFGAGLNKLRASGFHWVTSDNLQILLLQMGTSTGLWLAQWSWLCHLLAAFTLIVEFLHPLALVSRRLALFWVPAGIMLLSGIYVMMNISFLPLILLHVFWVPWNSILSRSKDLRR